MIITLSFIKDIFNYFLKLQRDILIPGDMNIYIYLNMVRFISPRRNANQLPQNVPAYYYVISQRGRAIYYFDDSIPNI